MSTGRRGRKRGGRRPGTAVALAAGAVALLVVAATGCGGGDDGDDGGRDDGAAPTGETDPSPSTGGDGDGDGDEGPGAAALCEGAARTGEAAVTANPDLTEVSGLAVSRTSDGVLWAHNDSGGDAEVFAVGADGADLGRLRLDGAEARDWEDVAAGPGPDGVDRLYVGDIGDNGSERVDGVAVYRIAEPEVPAGGLADGASAPVERLDLTYADGPHDAEALLADPLTGDLLVVTKEWVGGVPGAYRVPSDAAPGTPVVMERVGDVPALEGQMITAGDVAADGSVVALRTYGGVLLWDRPDGGTVADALAGEPCEASAPFEIQGEALALTPDGRGYVTMPEGESPGLSHYAIPD